MKRPARPRLPGDAMRWRRPAAIAGLLTLATIGIAAPAASAEDSVRLAGVTYLGDLPTLVARERGLFARHGVDVTVTRSSSGRQNLADLRAGRTDFALMALTPFVLDRLTDTAPDGDDAPVILASLVHSTSLNHVVALDASGIEAPADLRGRTVGLMKGTNAEFLWWLFTAYHHLEGDAIEVVDHPVENLGAALLAGEIDAAVIWEPWTTRLAAEPGGGLRRLPGSRIHTAKWVLVTTRGRARENAELARNMLLAYRDAIRYIDDHPRQATSMHAEEAGITLDDALELHDAVLFGLAMDWSLIATLQQQVEWARTTGHAPRTGDTDIMSWIDPRPLEAAVPVALGIPHALTGDEDR